MPVILSSMTHFLDFQSPLFPDKVILGYFCLQVGNIAGSFSTLPFQLLLTAISLVIPAFQHSLSPSSSPFLWLKKITMTMTRLFSPGKCKSWTTKKITNQITLPKTLSIHFFLKTVFIYFIFILFLFIIFLFIIYYY